MYFMIRFRSLLLPQVSTLEKIIKRLLYFYIRLRGDFVARDENHIEAGFIAARLNGRSRATDAVSVTHNGTSKVPTAMKPKRLCSSVLRATDITTKG